MRKAKVYRLSRTADWKILIGDHRYHPTKILGHPATHAEAMFLAQLLVDPARYIRQAKQRAWAEGHKAGVLQEYFRVPGVPNSYREENQ